MRERGRNRARHADDVDVENVMPFVVRVVLDRSLGAYAGVGDHDVDPTLTGDDLGDRRVDRLPVCDITCDVTDCRSCGVDRWLQIEQFDACAACRERMCGGESDSGRAARDARDEALEVGGAVLGVHCCHSGPSGKRNRATLSGCMRAPNPGVVGAR